MISHLLFHGYAGAGKSTVIRRIAELYPAPEEVIMVPRITTRKRRPGELDGEYKFVNPDGLDGFNAMEANGLFMPFSVHPTEKLFKMAIPIFRDWPEPQPNTKVMLSIFGRYCITIKDLYVDLHKDLHSAKMVTIFLTAPQKDLDRRLIARAKEKGLDPSGHLRANLWRSKTEDLRYYDHIVRNEDGALERCVRQIQKIAGLLPGY